MPRGTYKHPPQCGFQKGHSNFGTQFKKGQGSGLRGSKHPQWKGGRTERICIICGKKFKDYPSRKTKYCSSKCYWKSLKEKTGEKSHQWKGDNVSYSALHHWVEKHKGKPKICKHCKATSREKRLEWANKDHKYRRDLNDYISLCYPCHKKYDKKRGYQS